MQDPTPYPDLNAVLATLIREVRAVLADDLVAACLQGSFAVGDFDEHSDVDFIVATRADLATAQAEALQAVHGRVFDLDCAWAQHLEGSYYPADVLRSAERVGEALWYLDNGSRALVRSPHCNTLVVRQTVRQHGIPLAGPAPVTLVEPIPVPRLQAEIRATIIDWGAEILADPDRFRNRFYQGYIALNFCRMWCDLTLGTVGSKRRGAEWAKARLDPGWDDLIDRAWDTRPVPEVSVRTPPDPADFERTLALVALVIERARSQTATWP